MTTRRVLWASWLVPVFLGLSSRASADQPTDLEEALAEPVVSTASKAAEGQEGAPATTTSISAEDLRRYGIHSLNEAINYLSLGMITTSPLHAVEIGTNGVVITGDYGNHILLLINGHALNEQWDGTAYFERGAGIPFELIDHIEIILGPGSVLYGNQAMLGVINVITKRAKDYEGVHLIAESDIWTSWRGAVGAGHEFQLFGKPAEVTAQVEYYAQDGPAFTFAPQNVGLDANTGNPVNFGPFSPYPKGTWGGAVTNQYYARVPAGLMRLIVGDFELTLKTSTYQRATPYFNYNTTGGDFNNPNNYELDRFFSADLKHRLAISSTVQLRSRIYGDTYDYTLRETISASQYCSQVFPNGCRNTEFGFSRWAGVEEQLAFDWLHNSTLTTLAGGEARLAYVGAENDQVDLVTGFNPGSTGVYTHSIVSGAGFLQQTWQPVDPLSLNVGARLDADQRISAPHVSPRAAVVVKPWKGGALKGIYSTAFRVPTSYESATNTNIYDVANPNLKPELVQSFELSFEQRFGLQRIFFGGFQTSFTDLISSTPLSGNNPLLLNAIATGQVPQGTTTVYQEENVNRIDSWGANMGFDGALLGRDLRYGINLTGAYARASSPTGGTSLLPVAPQFFGNTRISYDLPGDWPVVGVVTQLQSRRLADQGIAGGFTPIPFAPPQVEVRATISGPVPQVAHLSYRFSADYAITSVVPYVAGPNQAATPTAPTAVLAPVDQFRTTMGLQYDFF